MRQTLPATGPIELEVRNPSGTTAITAAETAEAVVEVTPLPGGDADDLAERTRVEPSPDGRRLTVVVPERRRLFGLGRRGIAVSVTVPVDSSAVVRTASGETVCVGRLAQVRASTASGSVRVAQATGLVEVHGSSGETDLGAVGRVTVQSASGPVRIGVATGDLDVSTASGRVVIGTAEASVRVRTASGDVAVGAAACGAVDLTAASGDLQVGVRPGTVARLDLFSATGRLRSELPIDDVEPADGPALTIRARTASGGIRITSAGETRVG